MCTVLLPPGDNPIAVDKYINIKKKSFSESVQWVPSSLTPRYWADPRLNLVPTLTVPHIYSYTIDATWSSHRQRRWQKYARRCIFVPKHANVVLSYQTPVRLLFHWSYVLTMIRISYVNKEHVKAMAVNYNVRRTHFGTQICLLG